MADQRTIRAEWGVACPSCKSDEDLQVEINTYASIAVDGTEPIGHHDWDHESHIRCAGCDWSGFVQECQEAAKTLGEGGGT